jgi:hypothetical protein
MENQIHLNAQVEERAVPILASGERPHAVLHKMKYPATRVLLVGPFVSGRQNSCPPRVRRARSLAEEIIEVLPHA